MVGEGGFGDVHLGLCMRDEKKQRSEIKQSGCEGSREGGKRGLVVGEWGFGDVHFGLCIRRDKKRMMRKQSSVMGSVKVANAGRW